MAFQGGQTNALAAVVTAVNRLVGIYRREAAISFTLVSGTNILFPDAGTDPYDNSGNPAQLAVNQTQLDTIIGAGNYDIGHLFVTSDGGVASTPCVCTGQKAEGLSGLADADRRPVTWLILWRTKLAINLAGSTLTMILAMAFARLVRRTTH